MDLWNRKVFLVRRIYKNNVEMYFLIGGGSRNLCRINIDWSQTTWSRQTSKLAVTESKYIYIRKLGILYL
jgi:hypothetical protein